MLIARFAASQVDVKAVLDEANAEDWQFLSVLPSQQGIGLLFHKPESDTLSESDVVYLERVFEGCEIVKVTGTNHSLTFEVKDGRKIRIKAKLVEEDNGFFVKLAVDS